VPSLKIDIIVDDQGRPVINNVTQSMRELAGATKQADASLRTHTVSTKGHESSMAGLTRTALRLYAAYYVVSSGIQGVTSLLMQGVKAIDDYNLSIAKMAAMMTGMMEPNGKGLAEQYQEAHAYASQLNVMIEQVDKNTLLTASDLRQITEEMLKQGVVVDTNNKKQVEAFTNISNALAVIAAGAPNKEIQLRQEIRALLSGQLRDTDQLSKMLNAQTGNLKEQIEKHKEQGDLIEWLGQELRGFAAAQGDINSSWEAMKTSLETIYNQILRTGFQSAFRDITGSTKKLSDWATEHRYQIAEILEKGYAYIKIAFYDIKNLALDVWSIMKGYEPLLRTVGGLALGLADAFGGVYARLRPIAEITGTILAGWLEIATAVLRFNPAVLAARMAIQGPGAVWKDVTDTYERGKGIRDKLEGYKMADIPAAMAKGASDRKAYQDAILAGLEGSSYDITGWGGAAKPKLKTYTGGDDKKKAADAYATALRQITDETKAWQDKIAELNPALDKEDNAILKLTNDADTLIKKLQDQAAKGKVNVADQIATIRAGLEQGIQYISEKEMTRLYDEYQKLVSDEVDYGLTENERAANLIIHKEEEKIDKLADIWARGAITDQEFYDLLDRIHSNSLAARLDKETEYAKKVADINYGMINGIRGMEQWAYDLEMQQIEARAAAYLKDGADQRAVAAWTANEQQKAWVKLAQRSNSVTAGISAAWYDLYQNQLTWGQASYNVMIDLYQNMGDAFGSSFYDVITGDLDDLSDVWDNFWKSMLTSMTNQLGQMVAQWLLFNTILGSTSGTSFGGMSFGGMTGSGGLGSLSSMASLGTTAYSLLGGAGAAGGMLEAGIPLAMSSAEYVPAMASTGLFGGLGEGAMSLFSAIPGWGWALGGASLLGGLFGGDIISGVGDVVSDIGSGIGDVFDDIGDWFGDGAAFSGGRVTPFARGGIFNSPTLFPMASGMGLMGEAGPEAVMPLTRGSDGKLGVKAQGGAGGFSIGELKIFIGDKEIREIARAEADGQIVARNQRGSKLNPVDRVYQ